MGSCQLFTSLAAVVDIIMNMEIGLLDFQSRGGHNTNFPNHPHHGVPLHHPDFSNFNAGQSSNSNQIEAQNSSSAQGRAQQNGKSSWNLDELMTDLSMVYVSGDTDRLEGDKLQFCTVILRFKSSCSNDFFRALVAALVLSMPEYSERRRSTPTLGIEKLPPLLGIMLGSCQTGI